MPTILEVDSFTKTETDMSYAGIPFRASVLSKTFWLRERGNAAILTDVAMPPF
jgi:hypothetical protein